MQSLGFIFFADETSRRRRCVYLYSRGFAIYKFERFSLGARLKITLDVCLTAYFSLYELQMRF